MKAPAIAAMIGAAAFGGAPLALPVDTGSGSIDFAARASSANGGGLTSGPAAVSTGSGAISYGPVPIGYGDARTSMYRADSGRRSMTADAAAVSSAARDAAASEFSPASLGRVTSRPALGRAPRN